MIENPKFKKCIDMIEHSECKKRVGVFRQFFKNLLIDINSFIVSIITNMYVSLCAEFQIALKRKGVIQIAYVCILMNFKSTLCTGV